MHKQFIITSMEIFLWIICYFMVHRVYIIDLVSWPLINDTNHFNSLGAAKTYHHRPMMISRHCCYCNVMKWMILLHWYFIPSKTHQEYLLGVSLPQNIFYPNLICSEKSAMFLDAGNRWPVLYMVESFNCRYSEFLSPCSDVLQRLNLDFNAVSSEGSKVKSSWCWSLCLPLRWRDASDISDCRWSHVTKCVSHSSEA